MLGTSWVTPPDNRKSQIDIDLFWNVKVGNAVEIITFAQKYFRLL